MLSTAASSTLSQIGAFGTQLFGQQFAELQVLFFQLQEIRALSGCFTEVDEALSFELR
jgi:hypothetical protein